MLSLNEYKSMEMVPLKPTSVTIQVADRHILYPEGVIEDVLVKVNNFIYPVDFYVVNLSPDLPSCQSDVLLGRPFLRTAKAKIDCSEWSITIECFGDTAKFDMGDSEEIPSDRHSIDTIDILDPIINATNTLMTKDPLEIVLCSGLTRTELTTLESIAGTQKGLTK